MAELQANGLTITYDSFGAPDARPLLLIMGLGAQMILWDEEFCGMLAEAGHYVIRFDNRDVGLSSHFDGAEVPGLAEIVGRLAAGEEVALPYSLDDMADDAAGVLDALGIASAHICGASMGGMIAQTVAIRHPQRVRSLISIMSTTGDPALPQASPEAMAVLTRAPATDRAGNISAALEAQRVIGGKGFPPNEERIRRRAERSYDRAFYPEGSTRQLAAIMAHGSREEALQRVKTPALVIHGTDDPLVPPAGGRATHAALAGSELLMIEGMGHDLPPAVWAPISQAITRHTMAAEEGRGRS